MWQKREKYYIDLLVKPREAVIYNKIILASVLWFELIGLNTTPRSKSLLGQERVFRNLVSLEHPVV